VRQRQPIFEEQHLVMTETVPARPFDDMEALAWLRSQRDGRVTVSAAELGEIQRRFTATIVHHGIDPEILNRNLFVDSGRDQSLVVLRQDGRETKVVEPVVESLIAEMIERGIHVLIVDPFISAHEIGENDNNKIQQVANQFVRVANEANAYLSIM
jgi:hypothetical protein